MHPHATAGAAAANDRRPAFVVEDDPMMRRLLSEVAASLGLRPRGFRRLSAARAALREEVPAVLVVDDDLPDGFGTDLVEEVMADPRTRDVGVVVCTGAGRSRREEIARLVPVVPKPFDIDEMERALRRVASGAV
jgi:DNA-binding NtrC family response regulator